MTVITGKNQARSGYGLSCGQKSQFLLNKDEAELRNLDIWS